MSVYYLDSDPDFRLPGHDVPGDPLVNHSEGSLSELPDQLDFIPVHLPLIRNVNCKQNQAKCGQNVT